MPKSIDFSNVLSELAKAAQVAQQATELKDRFVNELRAVRDAQFSIARQARAALATEVPGLGRLDSLPTQAPNDPFMRALWKKACEAAAAIRSEANAALAESAKRGEEAAKKLVELHSSYSELAAALRPFRDLDEAVKAIEAAERLRSRGKATPKAARKSKAAKAQPKAAPKRKAQPKARKGKGKGKARKGDQKAELQGAKRGLEALGIVVFNNPNGSVVVTAGPGRVARFASRDEAAQRLITAARAAVKAARTGGQAAAVQAAVEALRS